MPHRSLRRQLLTAMVAIAAVPLLIAGGTLGWRSYVLHVERAYAHKQEVARRIAVEARAIMGSRQQALESALLLSGFAAADGAGRRAVMTQLLAMGGTFRELSFFDAAGAQRIRLSDRAPPDRDPAAPTALRQAARQAIGSGKAAYGRIDYDAADKEPLLPMAVPVRDLHSDRLAGALVAEVRFQPVWDLVAGQEPAAGKDIYLLDDEGRVIAHRDPAIVRRQTRFEPREGSLPQPGLSHREAFVAVHAFELGQQGFRVVAERDVTEVLRPAIHDLLIGGGIIFLTLSGIFVLGMVVSRRISRPIVAVSDTARAIRDGALESRVPIARDDEIGELAESFNAMTSRLEAMVKELEAEVAERTRAQQAQERLNRAYRALGTSNRAVTRATDEASLLAEACRIVKEDCGYRLVWAGLAEHDEARTVRPVAQAGFEAGYLASVNITWADSERGRGPTGRAIRERRGVICNDVLNDPDFAPWREQAVKRGYGSSAAFPIHSGGEVLGALMAYSDRPQAFTAEETTLLEELAENIGFGIVKLRAQAELERYRHNLEALVAQRTGELRLAKEAAEQANRAKSAFLANMSHELRTPLNAILGFAQIMARTPTLDAKHGRELAIINRAGRHLLSLIDDVLQISRIEAGRTVLQAEPFCLTDTLGEIEEMIRMRADGKGLGLRFVRHDALPDWVVGDPHHLRQVLINLLTNGVKYTDRGEVSLHLHRRDDRIRFEVRDTGPGIAPEERERIFQAFYQAPGGAGKGGGTGLGLTISRQFVHLMGGELAVSSEAGQGSCFSFDIALPPAPAPAQPAPSGRVTGLAPGQKACRVLVAEDDPDGRELVARLLESVGFQVRTVENGEQAVAAFQDWKPDFICLDMRMPVLDGYQAAARIRALPGGREVAIAALTGSTLHEDRDAILAAGCDDALLKPIEEEQLFAVIGRLLGLGFTYSGKESGAAMVPPEADLSALPAEIRAELGRAAEMLDRDAVGQIVDRLRPDYPDQARTIAALVDNYHFDRLLELCSPQEEKR